MILILDVKLHRRLDQDCRCDHIRLMVRVQVIQEVAGVLLRHIDSLRGAEELRLGDGVVGAGFILAALEGEAVRDLDLKELELGLVNGEVRHLYVQAVEVDPPHTLLNVLCELALAYLVDPLIVRKGACLMELAEKLVYLECAIVEHELVPEGALLDGAHLLIVADDLLEIPGESENIGMLLLIESHVDT